MCLLPQNKFIQIPTYGEKFSKQFLNQQKPIVRTWSPPKIHIKLQEIHTKRCIGISQVLLEFLDVLGSKRRFFMVFRDLSPRSKPVLVETKKKPVIWRILGGERS